MQSKPQEKRLIGRIEKVIFPTWDIPPMDGKVDTGAFTSSLHCTDIRHDPFGKLVTFSIPLSDGSQMREIQARVYDLRNIKSSNGIVEERVVIITSIEIGGEEYKIEISLTDRSDMKYPVLLGRKFLRNKFIVDVSKTNIAGKSWRYAQ